jgi:hypothetical protein
MSVGRSGKFLLASSAVTLFSESRGTHRHIFLSHDSGSRVTHFKHEIHLKLYKNEFTTSHKTRCTSISKINLLMLITDNYENHTQPLCTI